MVLGKSRGKSDPKFKMDYQWVKIANWILIQKLLPYSNSAYTCEQTLHIL